MCCAFFKGAGGHRDMIKAKRIVSEQNNAPFDWDAGPCCSIYATYMDANLKP
jgi:hypothetical protein